MFIGVDIVGWKQRPNIEKEQWDNFQGEMQSKERENESI